MAGASKAKRIAAVWVDANTLCLVCVIVSLCDVQLRIAMLFNGRWAAGGNPRDPDGPCQQIEARGELRMPAASQIIPAL